VGRKQAIELARQTCPSDYEGASHPDRAWYPAQDARPREAPPLSQLRRLERTPTPSWRRELGQQFSPMQRNVGGRFARRTLVRSRLAHLAKRDSSRGPLRRTFRERQWSVLTAS